MNIQSTSASAGAGGSGGGGAKAAAAPGAGAFEGVLVQKIGGDAQQAEAGKGLAAPLQGWIGALQAALAAQPDTGLAADGETGGQEELAGLLDGLEERLGGLQDDSALPESVLEQLAGLLAVLQGLLTPQATNPDAGAGESAAGVGDILNASGGTQSNPLTQQGAQAAVVPALLDAVKQLRNLMQEGQLPAAQVATASAGIKLVNAGLPAETAPVGAKGDQRSARTAAAAVEAGKPPVEAPTGEVAATSASQKANPAFKEPVVYWNLLGAAGEDTAEAAVQADAAVEPAADADVQPNAWLAQTGGNGIKAGGGTAAQSLPAQIPVQQFAEHMEQFLVKQFTLTGANGISEARINLHPEHLGEVQIRITIAQGQMSAQFVAHSEAAKDLLESQMAQLRGSLQSQGIQVDRVEVVQQQQQTADGTSLFQQDGRRQQFAGGGESGSSRGGAGGVETFEEELERTESLREAGFGGSLNVTA